MNTKQVVYAVIDTNVLVSALFSKNGLSNPTRIIEAVVIGSIIPVYNDEIIAEYAEVLARDKFKFNSELVGQLLSIFTDFGIKTDRNRNTTEYFPDPDDMVFYEVTMNVEGAYLITGNTKHFPIKPFIVTPAEMIEILSIKGLI